MHKAKGLTQTSLEQRPRSVFSSNRALKGRDNAQVSKPSHNRLRQISHHSRPPRRQREDPPKRRHTQKLTKLGATPGHLECVELAPALSAPPSPKAPHSRDSAPRDCPSWQRHPASEPIQ